MLSVAITIRKIGTDCAIITDWPDKYEILFIGRKLKINRRTVINGDNHLSSKSVGQAVNDDIQ